MICKTKEKNEGDAIVKQRLNEMDFMRPIVIVLLVMMHTFTIFTGGGSWDFPVGIEMVPAYRWIQVLTYGCMLEAFTFISGYLFGFQMRNKNVKFLLLVTSKLKRLFLPSVVFSLLYIIMFHIEWWWVDVIQWESIIYNLLFGAGHLWYLPMLFWCFIITWLLGKIPINESLKLVLLFMLSIASVFPIPLRFNTVFHYLPFFYLGVFLFNHPPQKIKSWNVLAMMSLFLLLLIAVTLYRDAHSILPNWQKVVLWYIKQLYAAIGTFSVFLLCKYFGEKRKVSKALLSFNACCFGIYIFHQFVLVLLYYYTSLPAYCGSYWLPWCGLFCAFFMSFGLTWILRKTKTGHYLLG